MKRIVITTLCLLLLITSCGPATTAPTPSAEPAETAAKAETQEAPAQEEAEESVAKADTNESVSKTEASGSAGNTFAKAPSDTVSFNAEEVAEQLITRDYTYTAYHGKTGQAILIVENTSEHNLTVKVNAVLKNDSEIIASRTDEIRCVEAGSSAALWFANVEGVTGGDYTLTPSLAEESEIVAARVGIDASLSDDKAFVTFDNSSNVSFSSLSYLVVFSKDGVVVDCESTIVAASQDFNPGTTIVKEVDFSAESYDNIEVVLLKYRVA